MVNEECLKKLVNLYNTLPHASLYFEELATMHSPKPNIDIERRRMGINAKKDLRLSRDTGETFFKELQNLKLGKLFIIRERGQGNSRFEWTEQAANVVSVAQEVIRRASHVDSPSIPMTHSSSDVIYLVRLRSGKILQLSKPDLLELQEFSQSVL